MDELVTDLSSALDRTNDPPSAHSDTTIGTRESPSATPVRKAPRKRRGRKRRSDYPPFRDRPKVSAESNDSVEEALMDYIENISMCQSDSEEETSFTKRLLKVQLHGRENPDPYPVQEKEKGESDSVSDPLVGFTKRRKKRKRKLKRVSAAQSLNDRDSPLGLLGNNLKSLSRTRKRKVCGKSAMGSEIHNSLKRRDEEGSLADIENGLSSGCGEPMETNISSNHFYKLPSKLHANAQFAKPKDQSLPHASSWVDLQDGEERMMIIAPDRRKTESYESSGESDLEGFFTNDEGRLGDDEKEESSFECDVRINPWWDEKGASDMEEEKFQNIVNGVMAEYRRPYLAGAEGKFGLGMLRISSILIWAHVSQHVPLVNKGISFAYKDSF